MERTDAAPRNTPSFDESLISGYLDGELTQAEAQKVRLYLEDNPEARALFEDMQRMRDAAISTEFQLPADDQWQEGPRSGFSFLSRSLGWMLIIAWTVLLSGFALWQMAVAPMGLVPKMLVFGGLSGFALLLLSVGLDRLRSMPEDRYRRVFK